MYHQLSPVIAALSGPIRNHTQPVSQSGRGLVYVFFPHIFGFKSAVFDFEFFSVSFTLFGEVCVGGGGLELRQPCWMMSLRYRHPVVWILGHFREVTIKPKFI